MYPVHDDDAALLLSLTVAAKRRPAALDEIITALAMAQHSEIPREQGTPISRPLSSEQTNPWRREPPVLNLSLLRLQLPITPVFSI
jgi:hypothetical protein